MRKPSIHITETKLTELLIELLPLHGYTKSIANKKFISELLQKATQHQLTNRKLSLSNARIEKKAEIISSSAKGDAMVFSQVLHLCRKNLRHRGITLVKEGTKDWTIIKQAASLAVDFCNEFDLERKDGFKSYINIALTKMNKFSINKIPSLHQCITDTYLAKDEINHDPNKLTTEKVHIAYISKIREQIGTEIDYNRQPEKYMFFCKVSQVCIRLKVEPKVYIDAQFEAVAYRNGVPDPAQLIGEKAEERLAKYLYENAGVLHVKSQPVIDFKALRRV